MSSAPRPLRADAERNRDAILTAASEVFAERGADVPLEEVARRAGVGIATLYRRFPTRDDLVEAAFAPRMAAYITAVDAARVEPDAWLGLAGFVRTVCAMQEADAGFADVLGMTFPATTKVDRELRKATAGLHDVIDRAQLEGQLREDFVLEDLVLMLIANAGVVGVTKRHAHGASARLVAIMLDGLRAPGASTLPEPINGAKLARALRRDSRRSTG